MQDSRRSFVSKLGSEVAAATVSGYGLPLRRELKLRITNADAVVEDPRVKGCEFPPSVVTAGGRRFVFMSTGRAFVHEVDSALHILKEPRKITASERVYSIGGFDYELRNGHRTLATEYRREDVYWKKTYCGTFNVDVMPADARHSEWVFSINHNERRTNASTGSSGLSMSTTAST